MVISTMFAAIFALALIWLGPYLYNQWVHEAVNPWLDKVCAGLWHEKRCVVYKTSGRLFLAKRTQFRVIKFNDGFYPEVKTFGVRWKPFKMANTEKVWDSIEEAANVINTATTDIRKWIESSVREDPVMLAHTVVMSQSVVESDQK